MKSNANEVRWKEKSIIIVLIAMNIIFVSIICVISIKSSENITDITGILIENFSTVILSVSCSVISSILLVWLTSVQDSEKDEQNIQKIVTAISGVYLQNQSMSPKHFFCDTDLPHEKFNEMLNESIRTSKSYSFIGDSARFTCERLYEMTKTGNVNPELKIQIILPDFRNDNVYRIKKNFFETRERKINFQNQRMIDEIIYEEKLKTISCLYAIGKLKAYFDIEIYLLEEIPFMRIEITGDFLVLGFTQMQIKGKHYPPVMIYQDEEIFRQSFEAYIKENIERSCKMDKDELTLMALVDAARKSGISGVDSEKVRGFYVGECKSN